MKKLLIVVGAGASLEFGFPSVNKVDELFLDWAKEVAPLSSTTDDSLYSFVKDLIFNYAKNNPRNRINSIVNFENLLYIIQNLFEIIRDKTPDCHSNGLSPFISVNDLPQIIDRFKRVTRDIEPYDFHFLQSHLVDKLLDYFRAICKTLPDDKRAELDLLTSFFNRLKDKFELGFVTLNYDNVILNAMPGLKTGFDDKGKFDRDVLYDGKWNFCYHLHGSVHFDMNGSGATDMHRIYWNNDITSNFRSNSSGRSSHTTKEGLSHLTTNIIAGLDKSNQILRDPFRAYLMQLDKVIYESDAVLFMGYGFSDLHLNQCFSFIRDDDKKRKVVVIDWASKEEDGLRWRHDDWSYGLFTTIPFEGIAMGAGRNKEPRPVHYYKGRNELEKSLNTNYPLAVWYNGMLEACKHPDKILAELL